MKNWFKNFSYLILMSEFHGRCKQHFSRSVFSGISYGLCHDSFFYYCLLHCKRCGCSWQKLFCCIWKFFLVWVASLLVWTLTLVKKHQLQWLCWRKVQETLYLNVYFLSCFCFNSFLQGAWSFENFYFLIFIQV